MESPTTEFVKAVAAQADRRDRYRRRRRVGLVVGGLVAFALGGILALLVGLVIIAIARHFERSAVPSWLD
ncbi:MAG: hypothetical protein KGZ40_05560 [Clostridiales bacterium]|nr:hypothetical protein [Clostridiales bacterium]